ncbi:MAG: hypothetical protein KAT00_00375 [Planctomycetes bacterium]|nr:hypothetical protein [Planctomycetota bacterium]
MGYLIEGSELEKAYAERQEANDKLTKELQRCYPIGCVVAVRRGYGEYAGTVIENRYGELRVKSHNSRSNWSFSAYPNLQYVKRMK